MRTLVAIALLALATQAHALPFQRCFEISAAAHGVPLDLLQAVARTESALDPDARSHANAHGIMQIQWPGTARHLGFRRVAELYNPCLNIDGGARYLQQLISRYGGNETRALAAYNYGPTRIDRSPELPAGALRYAGKVASYRQATTGAAAPWAGGHLPLAIFDSATRARRMAAFLSRQLGNLPVAVKATDAGHAVLLDIPDTGLPALADARLAALGLTSGATP